jgi:CBS domain-containing protein
VQIPIGKKETAPGLAKVRKDVEENMEILWHRPCSKRMTFPIRHTGKERGAVMNRFLEYTVEQYMTRQVKTVTRQTSLRELEALFERHDFNAFPVLKGKAMVGLVTKFDFLKAFAFTTDRLMSHYDELMNRTVGEVMTEAVAVIHVEPAAPLTRALQLMVNLIARSFPVVAPDSHLVGIISREDIMRALKEATQEG